MRVKIYAPAFLGNTDAIDEDNYLVLPEGSTLRDVYKALKVPFFLRKVFICNVNCKSEKMDKALKEGDIISFLSVIAGG